MKILLTGHKGFIGSNLLSYLIDHEVTTYEWGDELPDVSDCDWVLHIGAISSTTERNVEKVLTQNLDFSIRLLDECIKHKVNFQYSSSASVYGNYYGLKKPFVENTIIDPRTPYAWSKYLFERHVNSLSNADIIIQGFRYFNVYGPGEEHKGDMASPYHKFKKQYNETGRVLVFENSEYYVRDFVHVDYVCNVHKKFLNVEESGIWNVGTGSTKSFLDVALSVAPYDSIKYLKMPDYLKPSYQEYTCADTTKLDRTLRK
jgi:ADP-L-glycero-D-manno-heptose 6-epimerase